MTELMQAKFFIAEAFKSTLNLQEDKIDQIMPLIHMVYMAIGNAEVFPITSQGPSTLRCSCQLPKAQD
jgi:hypothetical protein